MSNGRTEERDPNVSITEQASAWWVTLNAGEASAEDHIAFREWAERSPERIEAFLETARLTRVLKSRQIRWPDTPQDELARLAQQEGADVIPLNALADGARHKVSDTRNGRVTTALFAAAASCLAVLATLWIVLAPAHRYDTAVGELRSVPLEDGSIVTLNTASRIDVRFDENHRRIELLEGEALFQVAHDPNRPFDVIAGEATVRAVGTQFNVDLRPKRTVVTVVEGKVAVLSPDAAAAADTYLSAGEQLTLEPLRAALPKLERPANVAVVTAWMQRQLVFDHRPIGEVAEEFNRYNELQIQIAGDALRNEQMTGVFKANDPESFLEFVGRMPGVRIERDTNNKKVLASL